MAYINNKIGNAKSIFVPRDIKTRRKGSLSQIYYKTPYQRECSWTRRSEETVKFIWYFWGH